MKARSTPARRVAMRALVAIAWLVAGATFAQDPRAATAQKAARDWLTLTDNQDVKASYDTAGAKFKQAIEVDRWTDALAQARAPLGALERRTMLTTKFDEALPDGGPAGEFVLIVYRTSFAQRSESYETVTLERERDGSWRVIGYYIR